MLTSENSGSYACQTKNEENNVCICPSGATDFECNTAPQTKCYIQVTDPPLNIGCEDKEDSFYYLYSIPGFSPCYPQSFQSTLTVSFELICQEQTENGMQPIGSRRVGYPYRDVIKPASFNPLSNVSADPETEFRVLSDNAASVQVTFQFRDMKYLSKQTPFTGTAVYNDETSKYEGTVDIDFTILQQQDNEGHKYIVGGRTYFEASALSTANLSSFTFRGFFDDKDYVEPKSTLNKLRTSGWIWAIIVGAVLLLIAIIVLAIYCRDKKRKQAKKPKSE